MVKSSDSPATSHYSFLLFLSHSTRSLHNTLKSDKKMNSSIEENEGNSSSSNAEIRILLEFDQFRSINRILLVLFGVPLNLLIVVACVAKLANTRLKKKPRNILFLGAILSAFFALLTILCELIAYHYQSTFFCMIFGLSTGVAYTCLLYNLSLALLDRYCAVVRPFLHRKIVTVRNVCIVQTVGAVVILFLIKWPYLFGFVPLQCGYQLVEAKTIAASNALLILTCVTLNIIVFVKTKHYAQPDRVLSVSFMTNHPASANPDGGELEQQVAINLEPTNPANETSNDNFQETLLPQTSSFVATSGSNRNTSNTVLQVHGGNRHMETEATFTLIAGVFSLLIFTAPTLIIVFIEWVCRLIVGGSDFGEERCAIILLSMPYSREFLLYHLIYNPIMYMMRSREFSSTLIEKWTRTRRRRPTIIHSRYSEICKNSRINNATTMRLIPQSSQITNV